MPVINLGDADNTFTFGTPGDTINGQGGNDTIRASDGGNTLFGGAGADALIGGAGADVIIGDDSTDDMALNTLKGFGGNDVIVSYSWFDRVDAGAGDDVVTTNAQQTGQSMDGGSGNDTIQIRSLGDATQPINITMGSTCVTTLGGVAGASYLNFEVLKFYGGASRTTITSGNGDDFLLTAYLHGTGNGIATFDAGFIKAGAGNDTVAFNGITADGTGIEELSGGKGVDRLSWTIGISAITDLVVDGAAGTMMGLGRVFAHFTGFETVQMLTYAGQTGALDYTGIAGVDSLSFVFTSAVINTKDGNDSMSLNLGSGTVHGGTGDDQVIFSYPSGAVTGYGDAGNDLLQGGSGQATLFGGDGDDNLTGENLRSALYGGAGNDVLTLNNNSASGSGPGQVGGGSGHDRAILSFANVTTAFSGSLAHTGLTLSNGTVLTGIEAVDITSGTGNDTLTASNDIGGVLTNVIHSYFGDDQLTASANGASLDGGFGNDMLTGAGGADLLTGGVGDDVLSGGGGSDTLTGGIGRDTMTGGNGVDHFVFTASFETGFAADTADVITDFNRVAGDHIDLSAIDANITLGSTTDDAFSFISAHAFNHVAGELIYQKLNPAGTANDHTLVSGDINGDGIADFVIWLDGLITLKGADFVL